MRHQINNTNCVSFISLTGTVKHVVGGRNKQVLPQWICLRCNIQFDTMGSEIFFECGRTDPLSFPFIDTLVDKEEYIMTSYFSS
jgi:hypothetical protein